jgi:hypothetical protein
MLYRNFYIIHRKEAGSLGQVTYVVVFFVGGGGGAAADFVISH